ncbi:MAG TPA: hypothetical protein VFA41_15365 [Ktedonobacteraceae bacterium]|jgi:hypothetical protein|nr:hypothetical protein [Ktedonobacteraceae bacterium]HZS77987.1 hypothetical protein [Ktedonobacteraceae bacterium]
MVIQVHGFDWETYEERVMPAFAQWLIEGDSTFAQQLFEVTRCAEEERYLPDPMQRLRVWPRARAFVETLPRGPYSRREYQKLCSAGHFTALSDRYVYKHAPQLYQNSDALRAVWGAIVETFCLPWAQSPGQLAHELAQEETTSTLNEQEVRNELVALLEQVGLKELAQEVNEQQTHVERNTWQPDIDDETASDKEAHTGRPEVLKSSESFEEDEDESFPGAAQGVSIGHHPNTLHIRGWLAGISVRAMVFFEYLACGRRCMPFGYDAGEPFGMFIGYLTPDEVRQMASCLQDVTPPEELDAVEDYLNYRYQSPGTPESLRLIDEVLPSHAPELVKAIRLAARQGLGLICSVD